MANVVSITDSNFQNEIVSSPQPVLLDFGAEWCGPCKQLAPVVEEIARKYAGKLKVGYVDVSASPGLAGQFMVMSVPTLLFFRSGQVVKQLVGTRQKDELEGAVEELIGR